MRIGDLTKFTVKGSKKAIDIQRFSGADAGSRVCGGLKDTDNVTVLGGGAVKSMLTAKNIDVGVSPSYAGVYTYTSTYDPSYEIYTTPEWVYAHVCPESVLNYEIGVTSASRVLVADGGLEGKTEEGYRNIIAAFAEGEDAYIFYDAVCNIIDQRRIEEFSKVGTGIVSQYYSGESEEEGTSTVIYTVTQLWLDVIKDGKITTSLVDASLKKRKLLNSSYDKATLISEDNKNFKYASTSYLPSLGVAYNASPDKVYRDVYPTLATAYAAESSFGSEMRHIVRYRNRNNSTAPYGSEGEKLLMLPDMRLINNQDESWSLEEKTSLIPEMDGAVQHFERLFGYKGDRLYASSVGDCTDYTEGEDNLPATAAWQTVTSDRGGFTAIASFDGKVVAFTSQSMMTVRGILLPFSVTYIGAYGCKSQSALAVCGGYLYFASFDGIYRYNGSSVQCISGTLPKGIAYENAHISVAKGIVTARFEEYDGLYLYEPLGGNWTRQKGNSLTAISPDGDGGKLLYYENGYKLYDVFSQSGDCSFSVLLGGGERKRICTVTVTAFLADGAILSLLGRNGGEVMRIVGDGGETVTRSCILKNGYYDSEALHFCGYGDITLYEVRAEYYAAKNRLRHIR